MSWSELVSFYIDNHKDISEVLELERRARRDLPIELQKFICSVLDDTMAGWRGFSGHIVEVSSKYGSVWWAETSIYDYDTDVGLYYGVAPISESSLFDATEERPKIYLYAAFADGSQKKKEVDAKRVEAQKVIDTGLSKTKLKGVRRGTYDKGETQVLLYRPVGDLFTLAALGDREAFARSFSEIAQAFTEPFMRAL